MTKSDQQAAACNKIVVLGCLGACIYAWHLAQSAPVAEEPGPTAQTTFVRALDDYRNEYSQARSNKNDIQQNRISDTRKEKLLCITEPKINSWAGEVNHVRTGLLNSRKWASVDIKISRNVSVRGRVDSTENPELFETIARLNSGDHIRFSGAIGQQEGCLRERSVTQSGGMSDPEFEVAYSEITHR